MLDQSMRIITPTSSAHTDYFVPRTDSTLLSKTLSGVSILLPLQSATAISYQVDHVIADWGQDIRVWNSRAIPTHECLNPAFRRRNNGGQSIPPPRHRQLDRTATRLRRAIPTSRRHRWPTTTAEESGVPTSPITAQSGDNSAAASHPFHHRLQRLF